MTMLEKVKLALRITTNAYDSELTDLIDAALADLGIAGVVVQSPQDAIVDRAIVTYCKVNFGIPNHMDVERLKRSYDEQKAQLATASGYTVWS